MSLTAPPYGEVAMLYDQLVGDAAFANWLVNFEKLERTFDISVDTCADIACGTGQALLYFAQRGCRVYGTDISENMLAVANARTLGLDVTLLRQDMRALRLPRKVGLLTCNTDSLNYLLDEEDLAGTMAAFHDALVPGGHAVFDMNSISQLSGQRDRHTWKMRSGNVRMYWRSGYDAATCTATLDMRHVVESPAGNRIYREVHRERGYPLGRVRELLAEAGFTSVYAWDAAGLGPVEDDTRRYQILAAKSNG